MKIAWCFSGQPRLELETEINHIDIINSNKIDVYMHLWWHSSHMGKVFRYHSSETYLYENMSEKMIQIYKPKNFKIEDCKDFDQTFCKTHNYKTWGELPQKFYDIFTPLAIYSILCQSYSTMISTKLCFEENSYDLSVRVRTDAFFLNDIKDTLSSLNPSNDEIYFQSSMYGGHLYSGEHPNNPCDWFYCGSPYAVKKFSETWYNSIKTLYASGVIHNVEAMQLVAKNANLKLILKDFGVVVHRQIKRDPSTANGDPYFVPYQKYLEDFDEKSLTITKNLDEWPFWVKHIKFRKF